MRFPNFIKKVLTFSEWERCKEPKWFNSRVLEKKMPHVYYFNGNRFRYKAVYVPDFKSGHWSVYDYAFYRKEK
jgi:hypothetical protein